jgi:hypothetical protein
MKAPEALSKKVDRRWLITRFGAAAAEIALGVTTRKFTNQKQASNIMIDVGLVTFLSAGTLRKRVDPIVAGVLVSPLSFITRYNIFSR